MMTTRPATYHDTISVPEDTLATLAGLLDELVEGTSNQDDQREQRVCVDCGWKRDVDRHKWHEETCRVVTTLSTVRALLDQPAERAWPLALSVEQFQMLLDSYNAALDTDVHEVLPFECDCPCDLESEACVDGHLDHCPVTVLDRKLSAAWLDIKQATEAEAS